MSTSSPLLLALLACLGSTAVAAAQTVASTPPVAWRPPRPVQGSLVVLTVRPVAADSATSVQGELEGEPLHFEEDAGVLYAVGAVPIDAHDSIAARVVFARAGSDGDTMIVWLPVARRRAPREWLHAAPDLVRPPDSVAERIRLEGELVQEVRQRAHDTPRLWQEPFLRPRTSAVRSVFGVSRVFNGAVRSRHMGVDFAGARGAPVRAPNRGVVALVADLYLSGTTLLIDHGAGLVTGYLHLSRALVAPGDTVARGQLIGRVGASGRVTGPHLHWLAAYGHITFDPLDLLRLNLTAR